MNNKIDYRDLKNFKSGPFHINTDLEVYFGDEQIGEVKIINNHHPEGDDELRCFLPGGVGFSHHPVCDPADACQVIYEKFYANARRN